MLRESVGVTLTEAQCRPLTRHGNAPSMPSCHRGVWRCLIDFFLFFASCHFLFPLVSSLLEALEGGDVEERMGIFGKARQVGSEPAFAICAS